MKCKTLPVYIILFSLSFLFHPAYSQGIVSLLDKSTNPGEVLMEFDSRTIEVKGTTFINENWYRGDVILKKGYVIKNQLVRYDMNTNVLEVKIPNQIKIIPLYDLKEYKVTEEENGEKTYLNCDKFMFSDNTHMAGICRMLIDDQYGLIDKFSYTFKEAYYVPQLDMGSKTDKIIIKATRYLIKNQIAYPVPHKKKSFIKLFGSISDQVAVYMKENRLNHRKDNQLMAIIKYVNQLPQ